VFPANIVPVVWADVLNKPMLDIFFAAVTNEEEDANVAVSLNVLEPELEAAVTATLFDTSDSPDRAVSVAAGAPPVPRAT
jgi:phage terminase large subunit-like protein